MSRTFEFISPQQLALLDGGKTETSIDDRYEINRLYKLFRRGFVKISLVKAGKAYYKTTNLGVYHAHKYRATKRAERPETTSG